MTEGTAGRAGVVGNLNMDLILRGVETLPKWGQGVEASGHVFVTSGQAGYLALGLAALGVATEVVGNVGNDRSGAGIVADLAAHGIGTGGIETSTSLGTATCVAISRPSDGERAFVADVAHLVEFDAACVWRHWALLGACDVVAVVGIFDMPNFAVVGAAEVLAGFKKTGRTTVLDTGWDGRGWPEEARAGLRHLLPDVDYLIVNAHEAAAMTGESDPLVACRLLRQSSGGTVVVKCGEQGSVAASRGGSARAEALPVVPVDAVGAGDTYNAGFISALLDGRDLEECMWRGTAAATLYITRQEDRCPSLGEVEKLTACRKGAASTASEDLSTHNNLSIHNNCPSITRGDPTP